MVRRLNCGSGAVIHVDGGSVGARFARFVAKVPHQRTSGLVVAYGVLPELCTGWCSIALDASAGSAGNPFALIEQLLLIEGRLRIGEVLDAAKEISSSSMSWDTCRSATPAAPCSSMC